VQHFRLEPAVQPLNIGQNELCNDVESAEEGEIIDVDTYTTGTTGQGLGLSEPMAGQPHASDINPTWTQSRLPPPGSSSGPGPGFISLNDSPHLLLPPFQISKAAPQMPMRPFIKSKVRYL